MLTGEGLGIWKSALRARRDAVTACHEMQSDASFCRPVAYSDLEADGYDAIFLPGGHDKGVRDYLESTILQQTVAAFFQLYSSVGLFDTHLAVALAHTLFNIPLAVWILEGFMSGVPKEIDETAYVDGYSFPRFFVKIFAPMIASGIGVAAFFCFMFSWVELLLARTLTSVDAKPISAIMTRTVSASGLDWGVLAAAGTLTIVPGLLVIYFVKDHIARGFALGRV